MKTNSFLALFLSSILLCCTSYSASAQFWKKKKKAKTEQKKSVPTPKPAEKSAPKEATTKLEAAEKKERYTIAVLLPLNLKQNASKPFVYFYEGIRLATQELYNSADSFDIHIIDIADNTPLKTHLNTDLLLETDVVIAAVTGKDIQTLSDWSKQLKITTISVLSPSDRGIDNNPYFIVLQPSLKDHLNKLVAYSQQFSRNQTSYILYRNNAQEKELVDLITEQHKTDKIATINCGTKQFLIDSLKKAFDSTELNVVYVPILSNDYVEKTISILRDTALGNYEFLILGMPSWKYLKSDKITGNNDNITICYTVPFHYDLDSDKGQKVYQNYLNNFGTKITEMALQGYETIKWVVDLAGKKGVPLSHHINQVQNTLIPYRFEKAMDKKNTQYFKNAHLYIYTYHNGSLIVKD